MTRRRRVRLSQRVLTTLACLLPLAAQAQPAPPPAMLSPLPVEADRAPPEAERLASEVPAVSLPRAVFDRLPADRVSDILPRMPGVVTSGPPGEAKAFGLRGLTPDYTRVQVNGVSLPSAAGTRAFELMNMPGFLMEDVTIVRSPTAEYEGDGIGGRIALRTRVLPAHDLTELRAAAGGADSLFDGRHFMASGLLARRFDGGFGVIGGLTFDRQQVTKTKDYSERTFSGGPGGAGQLIDEEEPKDFRNIDAFFQLGREWDGGRLTLRPTLFREDVQNGRRRDSYRRLTGQMNNRTLGGGTEELTQGGIGANLVQRLGPSLQMEADAAFNLGRFESDNRSREYAPTGGFNSGSAETSSIEDDQYDLAARLAWTPWGAAGHELRTGVQFRRMSRTSDGDVFTMSQNGALSQSPGDLARSASADYDATETYLAAYVMPRLHFGRLIVSPGLRLERVTDDLSGSTGNSDPSFTDVLPSLPAVFRVNDHVSLRGSVARQVNRPKLEEIAPGTTIRGPRTYLGNPELEPARAWALDAGVDYATPDLFLSAGVFRKWITDLIEPSEFAPNSFRYDNVGDGRAQGIELEQRIRLSLLGPAWLAPLTLRANQTFLHSRVNDPATGPRRFAETPRFVGNVGLEWNDPALGTTIGINLTYTSARVIRSYDGNGVGRYKELDPTSFLDVQIEQRVAPGVSLFASGQNLLNENRDEFEIANGSLARVAIIDIGRTFFFGTRLSF